ncbi:hypothetical protein TIFTF001_028463 [Ficus carica]|uniref:Uncharacterized protein n=1 Tax=Ficus carica TaxID=3494 RepID=A0AA88DPY8_FICCA|nr:hypothetical protein TIFTF001_028463 [Ficus carica]
MKNLEITLATARHSSLEDSLRRHHQPKAHMDRDQNAIFEKRSSDLRRDCDD